MIKWGWIPTLSGDLKTDFHHFGANDLFGKKCAPISESGQFITKRKTSDISSETQLEIYYELPAEPDNPEQLSDIYSGAIAFKLKKSVSKESGNSKCGCAPKEVNYEGTVRVQMNGLAKIEIEKMGASEKEEHRINKLIFEVYLSLKEIFHNHVFHDDYGGGADSMLKLVEAEDETEAVQEIAIQYVGKMSGYLKNLKEHSTNLKERNTTEAFHSMYVQARGEFLYGLTFMETFASKIGEKADDYSKDLMRGIRAAKIIYTGLNDLTNTKLRDLTRYVLAFTVITVMVPLFDIFERYFSDITPILDIVWIIAMLLVIFPVIYWHWSKKRRGRKSKESSNE